MSITDQGNILFAVEKVCVTPADDIEQELLIQDFCLQVEAGEIVGLVGETGAGKSLSMRASVGLLPTGVRTVCGRVWFNGAWVPVTEARALRANLGHGIALLLQNARGALNPFMRVNAQIDRAAKIRGVEPTERSSLVNELLRSVGLEPGEFNRKYAHQLSGGQAQRIAMACALATDPKLLIADEPTTSLDVTTQREIISMLQRLCRERNMGLVLITHNLALVSEICDRVVLMHAGHIVESGSVRKVFAAPLHPYTKALMQAIPDVDEPHDLVPLVGTVPSRGNLGAGCRFANRCQHVLPRCHAQVPPFCNLDGCEVRCFLYAEQTPVVT